MGVYKQPHTTGVIVRFCWDEQMSTTYFADPQAGNEYADHLREQVKRIGPNRTGHGNPVPDPAPFKDSSAEGLVDPETGRSWAEILRDAAERALEKGDFKAVAALASAAKTVVPARRHKKGFQPKPNPDVEQEEAPAEEVDLGALTQAVLKTVQEVQAMTGGGDE